MITVKDVFEGNRRHVEGCTEELYTAHLNGQAPTMCVVYCSDSRENIHIISDIEPKMGEIFTVENAGNVVDGSVSAIGAVMYCLTHLKTGELLVLGHTGCGAVTAVFGDYKSDRQVISEHIRVLENVKRIALHVVSRMEGRDVPMDEIARSDKYLSLASEINVDYQCEFVKSMLEREGIEGVNVVGAMHDLHRVYGGRNGGLYLTWGDSGNDAGVKKKLVDYGSGRNVRDVMDELGVSFYKL